MLNEQQFVYRILYPCEPTLQINDAIEHWHHLICCTPDKFKHWNYQRSEMNSMLSYQIKLTPKNQSRLMNIQAQSGLHLNEIIQDAFYQQKLHEPPSLNNLNQLTTTQQAITFASILGDGSLRKRQSRTYSSLITKTHVRNNNLIVSGK